MVKFSVVFNDGFALADLGMDVQAIISKESGVEVKGFLSTGESYVYGCTRHVERQNEKNPGIQPILPRLDMMDDKQVFRVPGALPCYCSWRVFAAVHPQYMGIMTSPAAAVAFLDYCPLNSEIRELGSVLEATRFVNYYYLKFIFPAGAYIEEPIPYCNNFPLDTIVPSPYGLWFQNLRTLPRQIPFAGYPVDTETASKRIGEK